MKQGHTFLRGLAYTALVGLGVLLGILIRPPPKQNASHHGGRKTKDGNCPKIQPSHLL